MTVQLLHPGSATAIRRRARPDEPDNTEEDGRSTSETITRAARDEWTRLKINEIIRTAEEASSAEASTAAFAWLLERARQKTSVSPGRARHDAVNEMVRVANSTGSTNMTLVRHVYLDRLVRESMAVLRPVEVVALIAVADRTLFWLGSDRYQFVSRVLTEREMVQGLRHKGGDKDGQLVLYRNHMPVFSGVAVQRSTLRRALRSLEGAGHIVVERWRNAKNHPQVAYRIGIDWPAVVATTMTPLPDSNRETGFSHHLMLRDALQGGMDEALFARYAASAWGERDDPA